ncbi:MAG: phytanoyl-CoA dioxygenase family protein [Solirubrobacteraceae bacterium]
MLFRSKKARSDPSELLAELDALAAGAGPERARELLALRHRAGIAMLERPPVEAPAFAEPDFAALPDGDVPEVRAGDLTPGLVRAAFLRNGCLLVRGLIPRSDVDRLLAETDRGYAARREGGDAYEPFATDARYETIAFDRGVVSADGWGGLWPADAPDAALAMFDAFERAGLLSLAQAYLGERPAVSVNKSLLRRVEPPDPSAGRGPSAWHQDGAFLGPVRALNVWVALSRCGDVAPGMDLVPRRLDTLAPAGTEGAVFDWSVSQAVAEEAAGASGIVRPVFEPGDVLLFDELFLHATAAEPGMTEPRYAVECWFFGPSAYPEGYAPLAA